MSPFMGCELSLFFIISIAGMVNGVAIAFAAGAVAIDVVRRSSSRWPLPISLSSISSGECSDY